ncbi:hypothetical protein [Moorena sp. SIO3F7]|nr:hypothetical protein [Moorena sp. SIO3F7]NEQ00926.1 hypothetical protein [Moorena sp. SIO3F7]
MNTHNLREGRESGVGSGATRGEFNSPTESALPGSRQKINLRVGSA